MPDDRSIPPAHPQPNRPKTIHFKRSHFATHLPAHFLYSPSHLWIAPSDKLLCTVGFTKFATRMLGEMVDHRFEAVPGAAVQPGQILGWIEGFKAISDLYCIGSGRFLQSNPLLHDKIKIVNQDCYGQGWLYQIEGKPDANCVDVHTYVHLLNKTIDKILEKQKSSETP